MWMALIRPTWRLGINSLAGRRGRAALLFGAVTLAAALIVAIATSVQSVRSSTERRLIEMLGAGDARLVHLFNGRFDDALLEEVEAWPEVDDAVGRLTAALTFVRPDRRPDPETGLPLRITPTVHGVEAEREFEVRPVPLAAGAYPKAPDEIAVDSFVAEHMQLGIGDRLEVQRFGEPLFFIVSGIYERAILGALQQPQANVLLPALENALNRSGQLSDIAILLRPEIDDIDTFCAKYLDELPDQLALEPAEMARTGFDRRVKVGDLLLTLGAVFAFIACSFIIVIGMTTGVSERQRELAVIRCIGATRLQVFLSQTWIGLLVGLSGALIGVPLGIGLAALMIWWFRDLVPAGLVVGSRGIVLSIIGSMGAGLLGAAWPAFTASRVPPLRAVAVRAATPSQYGVLAFAAVGLGLIALQIVLAIPDDEQVRFWLYVTTGVPLMQIGYFLLAVPVFVGLIWLLGPVLSRLLRLPGDLLRQSSLGSPYRLGMTAGALMIGMALLVSTRTSSEAVLDNWLGRMQFADGFGFSRNGISTEARERIAALPFVSDTCPISYLPLQVKNRQIFGVEGYAPPNVICIGFEPEKFFEVNQIEWIAGTREQAIPRLKMGEGILVAKEFLVTKGLTVGDTLTLGAGRVEHDYEIVGVVTAAGLDVATQLFGIRSAYQDHAVNCVFADLEVLSERFDNPDVYMLQVNLADDITDEEVKVAFTQVVPGIVFISGRTIKDAIEEVGSSLHIVQSAVAFAALIVACAAAGNVIMANVASRQFEYGILRAVGGARSHLARLLLGEAAILAVAAVIVGTVFGLHAAAFDLNLYRDLLGFDLRLSVPWLPILIGGTVLILMTLLAAIPATWRLTRASPRALLAPGRGGG